MPDFERKSLSFELKADEPGAVSAIFSTFDVIDKDGDVTLKDAFTEGEQVRLLPAHNWTHYAIGKGSITADAERAVFNGGFNLNTTAGRDWYESAKDLGAMQEWSYGFDVVESEPGTVNGQKVRILKKLKVHEVSPVTLGAGVGTTTLAIKSAEQMTFAEHIDYAEELVSGFKAFADRVRSRTEARVKEGRVLSEANRKRIGTHLESLRGVADDIDALLSATERPDDGKQALALFVEYQRNIARTRDLGVPA